MVLEQIPYAIATGLIFGFLLALTAVGLTLIFGVLDIPNFAQGEFAAFGGFGVIALMGFGIGLVPAIAIALVLTFVAGVAVERLIMAPLYDDDEFFLLSFFASFGIVIAFEELLRYYFGASLFRVSFPNLGSFQLFGGTITYNQVLVSVVAVLMLAALYLFTRYTYFGLAIRALANDKEGAKIIGVDEDRVYPITFGIGSFITGMTGVLYGILFPLSPSIGVELTAFAFVIVVVGGIGSFGGTIAASLLIGVIDSISSVVVGSRYRIFVVFLILFLILIARPTGLRGDS
ncbi:branched-chain amino acid ABC transporter permease [Halorarum halobium]|uniref:branched-chain amino acid ABC transporter permease n=1 Tax=Halorarum halobium TaxID=3075121 RepID=UPI0028AADFAB|nr:branched-chain amino acid ABC transporter permease [Halobaculum sp. XH14]